MPQEDNSKMFHELASQLFGRVEAGFAAFESEEGEVGIEPMGGARLLDLLGLAAVLEEKTVRDCAQSPDGEIEDVQPEEGTFQPDPDLTTTVGIRDELCKLFPTVVVAYLVHDELRGKPQVKTQWIGGSLNCLGLLVWLRFRLRTWTPKIFADTDASEEESEISILEVKLRESGQIRVNLGPNVLQAAGCAALALGKAASEVLDSTRE
jgi:hypothetical protein